MPRAPARMSSDSTDAAIFEEVNFCGFDDETIEAIKRDCVFFLRAPPSFPEGVACVYISGGTTLIRNQNVTHRMYG